METELKFRLSEEALRRVERLPALAARFTGRASHRHEVTTYFDTPDLLLDKAGLTLRVREADGEFKQTLKVACPESIASRKEYEWPVAKNAIDASKLSRTPACRWLSKMDGRLAPVFVTEIERRTRALRLGTDGVAEMALDLGEIRAGESVATVRELEIELKSGNLGGLYGLALELTAAAPLSMEFQSKAERGYRLRRGGAPEPRTAPKIVLEQDVSTHDALRAIIGAEVAHLTGNEPPAEAARIEGVHQMRVAIRKLRSALVLFAHHLEPLAAEEFQNELRRLGQVLGDARDWGVFLCEALPEAEANGVAREWRALPEASARAELERANQKVKDTIHDPAFTGFVLGLLAWTEGAVWCPAGNESQTAMQRPLREIAPDMLDRLAAKARKRGQKVDGTAERFHALRKSLKKLRYGVGYMAGLYDARKVERYRKACKRLQKILGEINDAAVADRLAASLGRKDRPYLAVAVGALARWDARRRDQAVASFDKAWTRFRKAEPFWR